MGLKTFLASILFGYDARASSARARQVRTVIDSVKSVPPGYWKKYGAALGIAIEAGVLKRCREHDGCYFEGHDALNKAYDLGDAQFTAGELKGIFESRRELTDIIIKVVNDHAGAECPICASQRPYP